MQWKQLCITILQKCIILPIECDTSEVALTIFSTLNDRGLPLSDSDIFKAQIYRNLQTIEMRKGFTNKWKALTQVCKEAKVSIDDIFRYYTHVLRARNNDKSKEVGLRKFYAEEQYKRLKDESLMAEIMALAEFWRYINSEIEPENNNYEISKTSRKYLQCLNCYPNEYWKYPISVFFLKHQNSKEFDTDLIKVLKKHIAFLFAKFIDAPSVNAIKDDIYGTCIAIQNEDNFNFRFTINEEQLSSKIDRQSSSRLSRALLLLHAYLNTDQIELIPDTFDIEHIFPKKWQDTNYNGWNIDDAVLNLDRFGNKIVFEKKLNIQAGNGYFGIKKQKYDLSNIAVVKDLSNYHKNDWIKEDIDLREIQFKNDLLNFFKLELN
ncbi:HNH endonuclease family protein [Chryseobacterium sp. CH21]|uniref:HNH endonuclease family protein n=1 Tax=Chryseobacterium sp. CH21 TaxID=713556 RepID=UPI001E57E530|nr:HNH endonuclease family protein [Chryseobacterium sp. CH21]